jgi:hypothetical protein
MKWLAAGVAFLALAAQADAQASAEAARSGWQVDFTPYGWLAGLKGTVRDDSLPDSGVSIEQTWSDLFAKLERALMGTLEVRKGRWGGMIDAVDFRVRGGGTVTGVRGLTSLTAEGALAQQFYSAAVIYRARDGKSPIDVMGGARYAMIGWDIDIELSRPPLSSGAQVLDEKNDWIDPYIGARILKPLSKRWSLSGYGDVGGLGVGSKLTMQGLVTARFDFTEHIGGSLAYRAILEDYDKNGFTYDMVNAGPMLGIAFRW